MNLCLVFNHLVSINFNLTNLSHLNCVAPSDLLSLGTALIAAGPVFLRTSLTAASFLLLALALALALALLAALVIFPTRGAAA
eukprot:SAG31_NODE_7895_length_1571_cov_2.091712_2_plen_83_part_00